ncbi:hypothetical protein FRX31_035182 [Thalictrum thalictroides]|uniref:Uncharacterized protein n=1 Tax=Thalictrum thalictroides TaxID=46969 RepID=A0A7J6US01_THATH|nr:hypothetical protein FRX31_035182 [Thalictrum thalictroides]
MNAKDTYISQNCCKQIVIDNKRRCWDDAIYTFEDVRKEDLQPWGNRLWDQCLRKASRSKSGIN